MIVIQDLVDAEMNLKNRILKALDKEGIKGEKLEILKFSDLIKEPKKNKYNVADKEKRTNGQTVWDSTKEMDRWNDLLLMQRAGEISDLKRQVPFLLQEAFISKQSGVGEVQEINYIADFVYFNSKIQRLIIEDAKGFKTPEYKLKRKMMLYRYGDYLFLEV